MARDFKNAICLEKGRLLLHLHLAKIAQCLARYLIYYCQNYYTTCDNPETPPLHCSHTHDEAQT
jgi:hypothetical protein